MGFLRTAEHVVERWTTALWGFLLPARQQQGEVLAILLRQCDDNSLILGRQRVVAPNKFVIELRPDIHRQLSSHAVPVESLLANQVRRHAAEHGYTFVGPVVVDLRSAEGATNARFRIRSGIAPAERRSYPRRAPATRW
ncbi:FhaA domain-containing protein [Streptomyces sp. CB03234]|uniref:FhaA domain-containing protein n=1 Tax=Streptomyces sp. (strain CB03234) TaxID=1703937 RepID=UPI00093D90D1